jgi:hypothetical protein
MALTDQGGYVVPNVRIPKVLGILNILFAANILVYGLCFGAYAMFLPGIMKASSSMQKAAVKAYEDGQKADLEKLDADEKAAQTEEEKAAIVERRIEIRSRPKPNFGVNDPTELGFDDPRLAFHLWIDLLSSLVVNVMMLFAGIALVNRKRSGITLGIWTAGLKILRLIVVYGAFAIVIVPNIARNMGKVVLQAMNAQATGRPMPPNVDLDFFVRTYSIMLTAFAVGMIIFGSIYPIVTLWLLNKPGARAACSGTKLPVEGPDAW